VEVVQVQPQSILIQIKQAVARMVEMLAVVQECKAPLTVLIIIGQVAAAVEPM
jgi:hypothetical protein